METISESAEKTRSIAKKLAKDLKPGDVLCLYGDLGTGKTKFIQGLAQALGIKKRILSPSFVLVREYPLKSGKFLHVDLFRLEKVEAPGQWWLLEFFQKKSDIIAIEWADRARYFLPKNRIEVRFSYVSKNERKINIGRSH